MIALFFELTQFDSFSNKLWGFSLIRQDSWVKGNAEPPDVTLRSEDADGGRNGGCKVRDLAMSRGWKLKVEEVGIGKTEDLKNFDENILPLNGVIMTSTSFLSVANLIKPLQA